MYVIGKREILAKNAMKILPFNNNVFILVRKFINLFLRLNSSLVESAQKWALFGSNSRKARN